MRSYLRPANRRPWFFAALTLSLMVGCAGDPVSQNGDDEETTKADVVASKPRLDRAAELANLKELLGESLSNDAGVKAQVLGKKEQTIPFIDRKTGKVSKERQAVRSVLTRSDNSSEIDGPFTEWYPATESQPKGGIFIQGRYRTDKRIGEWTFFHKNGKVAKVVNYVDGLADGEVTLTREDGTKQKVRSFQAGKPHGRWQTFDEKGRSTSQREFKAGLRHGVWINWFPTGEKRSEAHWNEGKRHGELIVWRENGQMAQKANFVDGKQHGTFTTWNEAGIKIREVEFNNGEVVK